MSRTVFCASSLLTSSVTAISRWRAWYSVDDLLVVRALLDQLDDVEAAAAAQHLRDLTRLHAFGEVGEGLGHFVETPPAQVAAVERVLRVGIADCRGGEIHAAVDLLLHVVGLVLRLLDLLGAGAFGHADQDMRQMHFAGLQAVAGEQDVDFGVGDVDLVLHHALAQALHQQLVAQRLAEFVVVRGRRARATRAAGARRSCCSAATRWIAWSTSVSVTRMPVHCARCTCRRSRIRRSSTWRSSSSRGGNCCGLVRYWARIVGHRAVEFALQDHVVLGDGDDAIERLDRQQLRVRARADGQGAEQETENGDEFVHRQSQSRGAKCLGMGGAVHRQRPGVFRRVGEYPCGLLRIRLTAHYG